MPSICKDYYPKRENEIAVFHSFIKEVHIFSLAHKYLKKKNLCHLYFQKLANKVNS